MHGVGVISHKGLVMKMHWNNSKFGDTGQPRTLSLMGDWNKWISKS